jgi:RNA polymerase sigma-70 factor (ECF subfamily)
MSVVDVTLPDLERALAGDDAAIGRVVRAFTPLIPVRVTRVLLRHRGRAGRDARQEVADLTQEILCLLFANDARVLRTWDAARGLSRTNYVGLVAEREAGHIVRSGRRSPWALDPAAAEELERLPATAESPYAIAASKELFRVVWERLFDELTPKGHALFRLLFVDDLPVEEVCARASMQPDAVYAWRSRLLKRTRALAVELGVDVGATFAPNNRAAVAVSEKSEPTHER